MGDPNKPHSSYEDWKDSVNTLYLSNGKVLRKVTVTELWMLSSGIPFELRCTYLGKEINVPYQNVMYYTMHSE